MVIAWVWFVAQAALSVVMLPRRTETWIFLAGSLATILATYLCFGEPDVQYVTPFLVLLYTLAVMSGMRPMKKKPIFGIVLRTALGSFLVFVTVVVLVCCNFAATVRLWPVWLAGLPLAALCGARLIKPRRGRRLLRVRYLQVTWAMAAVFIAAFSIAERVKLGKTTLAERYLRDGGSAAATSDMAKLRDAEVLREILRKGRVWEDNGESKNGGVEYHRYSRVVYLGQDRVMADAASRLLKIGDPEKELPLITRRVRENGERLGRHSGRHRVRYALGHRLLGRPIL